MAKADPGKAAAAFMGDLNAKAERLRQARKLLATREERYRKETEDLFREVATLKAAVLQGLKMVGLSSVKVRGGDTYFIAKRPTFEIKNPLSLRSWAVKQHLVRVDKEALHTRLLDLSRKKKLPSFVVKREMETISVRKPDQK